MRIRQGLLKGLAMAIALCLADGAIAADKPVAGLPYAQGRSFARLDDYLAHLRGLGAIDVPCWRQVSPGVYELQVQFRRPGDKPTVKTRAELARELGFAR